MNSTTTPSGYWGGYFLKELTMNPLGMGWVNCFRTHNELTMDPLGILVFAPSERDWRRINAEFAAGTLQAEETVRRDPVPKYGGDDGVPAYRESPEL